MRKRSMVWCSSSKLTIQNIQVLFIAIIRSNIDCCAKACKPCLKKNDNLIDRVQWRKILSKLQHMFCQGRFKTLNMYYTSYSKDDEALFVVSYPLKNYFEVEPRNWFQLDELGWWRHPLKLFMTSSICVGRWDNRPQRLMHGTGHQSMVPSV